MALACSLMALAIVAAIVDPSLRPGPHDVFFQDRRALTWTILIVYDLFAVFLHELAHLVAAKAAGVNARMGVSNRLWNVVAETDLSGLWAVPKQKRYLPLMAGLIIDGVSVAVAILLLFQVHKGVVVLPSFGLRLIRALAFAYCIRILLEFLLFVRTDIYYLISTFFNCRNLMGDTEDFLRNQASRWLSFVRPVDQSGIPVRERRIVRAYAVLWIGGRVWALTILITFVIPVSLSYIGDLVRVFKIGYAADPSNFVDAAVLTVIVLVPLIAGLSLWGRELVNHKGR